MVSLPLYLFVMHQINYTEYLTTINQPIRELLTASKSPDVLFLVHNPNSNPELLNDMFRTVSRISPTTFVHLNRPDTNLSFHVSRRTLILYLYISKTPPNVHQTQEIADVITRTEARQKVLLITLLQEPLCNFESIFEQLWLKQLLNVAILELPTFEKKTPIMLHRYNPFSKVYDRREYISGVEFFPDKSRNLYGSPAKILLFPRADIPDVVLDSEGRAVMIKGPDAKVLESFSKVLNFTPELHYIPLLDRPVFETMVVQNYDISLQLPLFNPYLRSEYTVPLDDESWCPVVPINYPIKLIEMRAVIGTFLNYAIVLAFWMISRMLKLDKKLWQPLKIFGMILCMSVAIKPRRAPEKILIIFIFLASSFLSTNLYADLTTSHIQGSAQMVFEDFKDLENSGLTPVVLRPLFNITFMNPDKSFVALKEKSVTVGNMSVCAEQLVKYQNVTCLMEKKAAKMIIYAYSKKGVNKMIVSKNLCYAKPNVAYYAKKNSPIVERMSQVVMRLKESGLKQKWSQDFTGKFSLRKTHSMNVNDENRQSLVGKLIPVVVCGFFLSLLVFGVEMLLGRNEYCSPK